MSQKLGALISGVVLLAVTIFPLSLASAQAVSLQEQLAAQYKLVKMGSDTSGYSVVDAGTLLAVQKGGILAVPYSDKTILTTRYEGGTVHSPNAVAVQARKALFGHFSQTASEGQSTHLFAKGDKVYPTKIDVNVAKDSVTLGIVACDTCNKTDPPTYNKAQVQFQFPAGSLANASAGQVEDVIGQLLSISSDDSQQGGDQGGGQQAGNDQQGNNQQGGDQGGAQQAPAAPPAEPAQIEKGQTPDQVKAALGNPDKIVNLGTKMIYVYRDIKVTFLNGKVSDVQ
ncbi:MAG: hypothetical protein WBZ01_02415 [Terriglobales bacterium]|jgi:hypothetical protein